MAFVDALKAQGRPRDKPDAKAVKHMKCQLWGAHQVFFRGLCMAAKVPRVCALASAQLASGHSVVLGLQSTGAAPAFASLLLFVLSPKLPITCWMTQHWQNTPAGEYTQHMLAPPIVSCNALHSAKSFRNVESTCSEQI